MSVADCVETNSSSPRHLKRAAVSHTETLPTNIHRMVDKPGFLMVSITPTMLFVHRSLQLPVTDPWYSVVLEIVGDSEPVMKGIVSDAGMMLGKAEHLVYTLSDE